MVDAARDLDELLARCPGLSILATSVTRLRLRAEREYPVPALPLPPDPAMVPLPELASSPAVALFVDRAGAVRHDFALTSANAQAVVDIVRRLECLPLAIELAAARSRLLSPDALLRRLTTSLDALGSGPVDLPERQQTLRSTVEWSVRLLDDPERSLLETAAVFVGGWTLEAAAEVAALDEEAALDLTDALAGHSLIQLDIGEHGPRARMLETIRAFVAERLAARPDVLEIERRHADHYRTLAERADRPLRRGGHAEWAERLRMESGNLAAAVRWYLVHDRDPLPHLFRLLALFWIERDPVVETRAWIDQLMPDAASLDPQSRAEVLWTAMVTGLEAGDDAAVLAAREQLVLLLDAIEDPFLRAVSELAVGWSAPILGDDDGTVHGSLAAVEQLRRRGRAVLDVRGARVRGRRGDAGWPERRRPPSPARVTRPRRPF